MSIGEKTTAFEAAGFSFEWLKDNMGRSYAVRTWFGKVLVGTSMSWDSAHNQADLHAHRNYIKVFTANGTKLVA